MGILAARVPATSQQCVDGFPNTNRASLVARVRGLLASNDASSVFSEATAVESLDDPISPPSF